MGRLLFVLQNSQFGRTSHVFVETIDFGFRWTYLCDVSSEHFFHLLLRDCRRDFLLLKAPRASAGV